MLLALTAMFSLMLSSFLKKKTKYAHEMLPLNLYKKLFLIRVDKIKYMRAFVGLLFFFYVTSIQFNCLNVQLPGLGTRLSMIFNLYQMIVRIHPFTVKPVLCSESVLAVFFFQFFNPVNLP